MIITPKNWAHFQHYKNRKPAWIKLHRDLLDDYRYCCLPTASKALAPFLWLIASEYRDGKITATLEELAFRMRMTPGEIAEALTPLLESGFFDASEPLASRKQLAMPEKEREEEKEVEGEERKKRARGRDDDWPDDYREQFWTLYPNKVGKPKALAKLDGCRKRGVIWADLICGLHRYIQSRPPDRPWLNPETFINQERWADQPAQTKGGHNGRRTVHDAARELHENFLDRLAAFDEPAPGSLRDGTGPDVVRLLPARRGE